MGTRGLRVIKFRGRHWILYNQYDSYPEGMGKSLVDQIPTYPEEYQKWLQDQRALWAKWDDLLQVILAIEPEDLAKLRSPKAQITMENFWQGVFDERLESIPPSYHIGSVSFDIEWVYTIDLDREVFFPWIMELTSGLAVSPATMIGSRLWLWMQTTSALHYHNMLVRT